MTLQRFLFCLLIPIWGMMLTSCFEIHEELWLHQDTSGRAQMTCVVPSSALLMQGGKLGVERNIDAFFRDSKSFSSASRSVEELPGGRTRIQVSVAFDSALDLARLQNSPATQRLPSAAVHWMGSVSTRIEGLTLHLRHQRDLGTAVPMLKMLPPDSLRGGVVETTLHLPEAALRSNAPLVSDGGRTLAWRTSLAEAVASPIVIELSANIPIPWTFIATTTAGVGTLLAGTGWWWRRRRRSRRQ